jgi:hypothetical protein
MRVRKAAPVPPDIGELPVAAFLAEGAQGLSERVLVIHGFV